MSPFVRVARLVIPRQDIDAADARIVEDRVDRLAFNPWHTTDAFRPLGHINRARKAVYLAGSANRLGHRFFEEVPLRNRFFGALARFLFRGVNVFRPWHKLPPQLAVGNLIGLRHELRQENLIDTEERDAPPSVIPAPATIPEEVRTSRNADGSFNDLSEPRMGASGDGAAVAGSTFGRNAPLDVVRETLAGFAARPAPNPIEVSDRLLARRHFIPAKSLNLMAAAWIQFQVHDWVEHPRRPITDRPVEVPLPGGKRWSNTPGGPDDAVMRIAANIPRPTRDPRLAGVPVFENKNTPWWDGGQIYGYSVADAARLRVRDGDRLMAELRLENGHLPNHPDPNLSGVEDTGLSDNWWLGLSLMHTLFAREHNDVAEALRDEYPGWTEEAIYRTARMIVAALLAKIHTVEWTPAILATKAIDISLKGNWSGAPNDWLSRAGVWLVEAQRAQRHPGHAAGPPHRAVLAHGRVRHRVPHAPADPGRLQVLRRRRRPSAHGERRRGADLRRHPGAADRWRDARTRTGGRDLLVRRGEPRRDHAAKLPVPPAELHAARWRADRPGGGRSGARAGAGIPRYNDFRKVLHKPKVSDFSEITSNPEWARELREVYGSVDAIDTMVGLLAEDVPEGFGFSDTAFRVFIVMASRRLQSDRFLTVDYRPEVYSPLGLDWIARTGMKEVIARHCPELARSLPRDASAFAPWRPVGEG